MLPEPNNLYLGDCLDLMTGIPDGSVDMVMCDLPYGTTACKWDAVIPFEPLWAHYHRVCKSRAALCFTATQPFASALVMSNPSEFRYEWIWQKNQGTNPRLAKVQPLRNHEQVLVFYRQAPAYQPQMWKSTPYSGFKTKTGARIGTVYSGSVESRHRDNPDGSRYPLTVQAFRMDKGLHPTQKPVALMEYLIKTYTDEGQLVLDNCAGSGTTLLAARNTGRRFIGIEKDEGYYRKARERLGMVDTVA